MPEPELVLDLSALAGRWNRHADLEALVRAALAAPPEPPSNAAAMRGALESCLDFIIRIDRAFNPFMQSLLENAVAKAKAALAAPARNCDRFKTEDEAREAYWAYREPLEFNDKPFVAITEWLFATAEGGDHA